MSTWLQKAPKPPPEAPETVDYQNLLVAHVGRKSRSIDWLLKNGPKQSFDEWGQPLPLSSVGQDDLDRLVAVLKDPLVRTRDLMLSGLLNPDEVDAVKTVHPQVYDMLVQAATRDMLETKPPYQIWAQGVLDVLFQKPATAQYSEAQHQQPTEANPQVGNMDFPGAIPTQTDRREPAIREQARR